MGKIPSLSAVDFSSVCCLRYIDVYHARFWTYGETRLGLRYLHSDDDGLYSYQCSLWGYVGSDDGRFGYENRVLFLPDVLCLWWEFYSLVCLGTALYMVQGDDWFSDRQLAIFHDCDCCIVLCCVLALLQYDEGICKECLYSFYREGLQVVVVQCSLVVADRCGIVL